MTKSIALSRAEQHGHAVVLVPHDKTVTGDVASRAWEYCLGRQYEFVALVRDWPTVARMLGTGQANIVVMPGDELAQGEPTVNDGETVRLWSPGEASPGEATRDRT